MISQLTDALAARLSASTFTDDYPSIEAKKAYLPYYDNEQMTALRVSVIPREVDITLKVRGAEQHVYTISIVLAKRTDGSSPQVDALLALVERICDLLRSDAMPQVSEHPWPESINWNSVSLDPVWSQDHLEDRRIFFTAINVTYMGVLPHAEQQT